MIAEHEDRADRAHPGSSLKTGYIALLYETSSASPICEKGQRGYESRPRGPCVIGYEASRHLVRVRREPLGATGGRLRGKVTLEQITDLDTPRSAGDVPGRIRALGLGLQLLISARLGMVADATPRRPAARNPVDQRGLNIEELQLTPGYMVT